MESETRAGRWDEKPKGGARDREDSTGFGLRLQALDPRRIRAGASLNRASGAWKPALYPALYLAL
ncbi:hypothetical protein OJJOAM_002183 [Cupriavidus sp. H18C1]